MRDWGRDNKGKQGEDCEIGPFCFGRLAVVGKHGERNRDLLMVLYVSYHLAVANTFCDVEPCKQAAFRELGIHPMAEIRDNHFAQLDLGGRPPQDTKLKGKRYAGYVHGRRPLDTKTNRRNRFFDFNVFLEIHQNPLWKIIVFPQDYFFNFH